MPNVFTRGLAAGQTRHTPGEPPPFHTEDLEMEPVPGGTMELSRFAGRNVVPNPSGRVGYSAGRAGQGTGYLGRDLTDQTTWGGRPYAPSSGMLSRLHQEGAFDAG